jgi:hypothetical protein
LLDETAASHAFDDYIDSHVKTALEQLSAEGVKRFRGGQPSTRALRPGDILDFPAR